MFESLWIDKPAADEVLENPVRRTVQSGSFPQFIPNWNFHKG
jgi:hypothetical protein